MNGGRCGRIIISSPTCPTGDATLSNTYNSINSLANQARATGRRHTRCTMQLVKRNTEGRLGPCPTISPKSLIKINAVHYVASFLHMEGEKDRHHYFRCRGKSICLVNHSGNTRPSRTFSVV